MKRNTSAAYPTPDVPSVERRWSFERESLTPAGLRILAVSYLPIMLPSGVVDGLVGAAQDITQHRQEALRLRELSERDPLTGLLNLAGVRDASAGARRHRWHRWHRSAGAAVPRP